MSLFDCRGVPLSTDNHHSLASYEKATELFAGYYLDPLVTIDAALAEDPGFVMGHCLRAGLAVSTSERGALPIIEESLAAIDAAPRANDRERGHARAARAWLAGDLAGAVRAYGDVVVAYPRDLLALQLAHVGDFFLGQSQLLRDRVAQVMPAWDAGVPGFGFVLGMYAFGLEETALYGRAEDTGRRALELNARDPWAVHAVAHVMEMQGRIEDGIAWLGSRRGDWAEDNGFAYHNWWHLALFHLDRGEHERALALFDAHILPEPSIAVMQNLDAAALLWRMEIRGVDVGPRWRPLADAFAAICEDGFYAFNDAHAVMSFLGAGREAEVARTLASLERAAAGSGTNAMMSREVGLPLARALVSFARGEFSRAADILLDVRAGAHRFGGSHAQRDLISLTLLEAALRAGNTALARALAAERTQLKPASPFNWRLSQRAAELAGDRAGAVHAGSRASELAA